MEHSRVVLCGTVVYAVRSVEERHQRFEPTGDTVIPGFCKGCPGVVFAGFAGFGLGGG